MFLKPPSHNLVGWQKPSKIFHKAVLVWKSLMNLFIIQPAEKKTNKPTPRPPNINPLRNWLLLIRLTKKGNASLCSSVSLHKNVFSRLTLCIHALRDRDCHFNLYFPVLTTIVHDKTLRHYSNINSSNKINTMAVSKAWLEKCCLVTSLIWTFVHSRSKRWNSKAFSVKSLSLS